jgi:putative membrane protein
MRLREGLALVNALLTAVSIGCAMRGRAAIRKKNVAAHQRWMLAAFGLAAVFMVTFVTRIVLYGVATYTAGHGALRIVYLLFAGSHDAMAVISLPLVILSLLLGLRKRWVLHKMIVEVAYPVWVYSALSGITLYFLLYVF